MDQLYLFPSVNSRLGRTFPSHGFADHNAVVAKKFAEVSSATSVTFNLLLPFLNGFNARLESHVKDGSDLSAEELKNHLQECTFDAAKAFAVVTSKTAVQTALAAYLVDHKSPSANATVYLWDSYPRLHQKYVGDLLQKIRIPRFLASLLGPKTHESDVQCFATVVPFGNAFEDSLRRHVLVTVADITVTNAVVTIEAAVAPNVKENRPSAVVKRMARLTTSKVVTLLVRAAGGACGNVLGGGAGEYWGEAAGAIIGTLIGAQLVIAAHTTK